MGATPVLAAAAARCHAIIEPMAANDRMPRAWSRRSLLVALLAGSVTALSGCQVRLEEDAPRVPGLPTHQPIPDEQALLTARRAALQLQELAGGLGASSTPLTTLLATLHGRQVDVFESVLRSGGVPVAEISAATSAPPTSAGGTPAPTAVPRGVPQLIALEAEGLSAQALTELAGISEDRVALFGSMTAQRATAVRLLGGRLPDAGAPTGPTGEVAAAQLKAIRSAVYGFEVVVAQIDRAHRNAAATTLDVLQAIVTSLERLAGPAAQPIPLGYTLPFRVSTPATALRLATHLMRALRAAIASQLPAVSGDEAGLTGTVRVLTDVCIQAVIWQVPLTAFPGLVNG
jgi:Domain of unknown function (DUF4439)